MKELMDMGLIRGECMTVTGKSVRQFMELAVYMPEQEPQVGQTLFSNSVTSS